MLIRGNRFSLMRLIHVGILASTLLAVSISAQTERRNDLTALIKQHAVWDPAEFILDKLKTNRIVMIADAGHGDPLYTG